MTSTGLKLSGLTLSGRGGSAGDGCTTLCLVLLLKLGELFSPGLMRETELSANSSHVWLVTDLGELVQSLMADLELNITAVYFGWHLVVLGDVVSWV